MSLDFLRGFYPELDKALDIIPHDNIWVIFFARREDKYSVAVGIYNRSENDRRLMDEVAGMKIPRRLYETKDGWAGKIGIELTGIGSNNLRMYVSRAGKVDQGELLQGVGYYLNNNCEIVGKKNYLANIDNTRYDIEYYDSEDALNDTEREVPALYDDWNGPKELFETVKFHNVKYIFTKKESKDQAYFVLNL